MTFRKQYLRPVLVLVLICMVVGVALSAVNAVTAPIIAANDEATTLATYAEALPEADSFTQLECDIDGVSAVLVADNGAGYVIAAQARGYGGQVPLVVSFSNEGEILAVIIMDNDETPGMGKKVEDASFTDQFAGMAAQSITLDDIDAVSGATYSSKAVVNAINLAVSAFEQVTGGETQ